MRVLSLLIYLFPSLLLADSSSSNKTFCSKVFGTTKIEIHTIEGQLVVSGHRVQETDYLEALVALTGLPRHYTAKMIGLSFSLADTSVRELTMLNSAISQQARRRIEYREIDKAAKLYEASRMFNELIYQKAMEVGNYRLARATLAKLFVLNDLFGKKTDQLTAEHWQLAAKAIDTDYFGNSEQSFAERYPYDITPVTASPTPNGRGAQMQEYNRRYQEMMVLGIVLAPARMTIPELGDNVKVRLRETTEQYRLILNLGLDNFYVE